VPADETKPVVFLVDDSVDVHRLLTARLRHENIALRTFTKGADALAAAKSQAPATILLDLQMPGMDGFEVLRQLKDNQATHSVPVIVLSGLAGSEDKVTAFDLGATDYVTKPCDLAELRARLRASLRTDRLLRLLADRADVDGLTGLGNRAHFNKRWVEKVAECKRYKHPLSLAMLDVDLFKRINDTYGHPAGDEVLQGLAQILQRECRETDVPCRYGGEEFALIMPNTSPADAITLAERIRSSLAKVMWARHPETPVTVSIGLAGTAQGQAALPPEQWIEAADRSLYAAKHQGRDRVVSTDVMGNPASGGSAAGPVPKQGNLAKAG
jgi:two-component system cell cycle response regulator